MLYLYLVRVKDSNVQTPTFELVPVKEFLDNLHGIALRKEINLAKNFPLILNLSRFLPKWLHLWLSMVGVDLILGGVNVTIRPRA